MYCSSCGVEAEGGFCWKCGAPLHSGGEAGAATHWSEECRYELLLREPEVRELIAGSAGSAPKRMSGEAFLDLCDKVLAPLTGVSLSTVAAIVAPIAGRLGIKTGKTLSEYVDLPVGAAIVAAVCSLARHGCELRAVHQGEDGCALEATVPSDLWSFEGTLLVTVAREGDGVFVEAGTTIPGQMFDWGKSKRYLAALFEDIRGFGG